MKKTICKPLAIAALIAALSSCAGDPVTPPDWAQKVQSVYSQAAYIAQRGEGKTRQDAELDAAGAVARYIESQITAEQSSRRVWTGDSESESRTETSTVVRSQTRLVALRYAEDPWRNPATDKWETVAYIEREEAWILYEPQAKKAAGAFLTLDAAAQNEAEPFTRALRYGAAAAYANGAEYGAVRGFAQVLHPQKAQACFAEADRAAAALPEKLYAARQNAPVFVDCPADLDGIIRNAAVAALSAEGFPAEQNRAAARALLRIRIDEGMEQRQGVTAYTPALSGTVEAASVAVFSFNAAAPRQAAVTPEVAKRRAYTALAAALGQSFSGELNRKLALYEKQ
ncbi:MAG: hypothetical protein Pg6C_03900 [Treponemataceae bacterium]|nr:MAG: hypothetical protein Pg6C_03900 [Treponemataceae bacterium]